MPDFDGLPLDLYRIPTQGNITILPYQLTSGCKGRCSFCSFKYVQEKLEFKSPEKAVHELAQLKQKYNSRAFYFTDNNINNSYAYLDSLCDAFIRNKLDISWAVYAKAGSMDFSILKKMKRAGCSHLVFGIESGSDRILQMMNKGFTSEQASQTLKMTSELGIKNITLFIAGYPHETQEDVDKTAQFIRKNRRYIYLMQTYRFVLDYGCAMYSLPERHGITNLTSSFLRYYLTFDEIGGLKWEEKRRQQEESQEQLIKTIHKSLGLRNIFSPSLYFKI